MTASDDCARASEAIARLISTHPETVRLLMAKHGAIIESKAAPLTPVDTGLLRRATASRADYFYGTGILTIENRMEYAAYQHFTPGLKHKQPRARDRFIEIPFERQVPRLVKEIIDKDIEEATE